MSELAGFINAILNDLDDDTARLVFADWLDEHPNVWPEITSEAVRARADFIRVQVKLARLPEDDPKRAELKTQEEMLIEGYGRVWSDQLGYPLKHYSRGLSKVRSDTFCLGTFTDARIILAREPFELELDVAVSIFWGDEPYVDADDPILRTARSITCDTKNDRLLIAPDEEYLTRLLASPHLINLKDVALPYVVLNHNGVLALLNSPAAFRLRSLRLDSWVDSEEIAEENDDIITSIAAIATSQKLSGLERLELNFGGVGAESLRALLTSTTLPATMKLERNYNAPNLNTSDPVFGPLVKQLEQRYRFTKHQ